MTEQVQFRNVIWGNEILWRDKVLMRIADARDGEIRGAGCMAKTHFWVNQLDDLFERLRTVRGSTLMFHALCKVIKGESVSSFHGNVIAALVKRGLIRRSIGTPVYAPIYIYTSYEEFLKVTEGVKVS